MLVEEDVIAKLRIVLQKRATVVNGTPAIGAPQEQAAETPGNLVADLGQVHPPPGADRAFE